MLFLYTGAVPQIWEFVIMWSSDTGCIICLIAGLPKFKYWVDSVFLQYVVVL
jgi:hypothetical protein